MNDLEPILDEFFGKVPTDDAKDMPATEKPLQEFEPVSEPEKLPIEEAAAPEEIEARREEPAELLPETEPEVCREDPPAAQGQEVEKPVKEDRLPLPNDELQKLHSELKIVAESAEKIRVEVREMHKLYHNDNSDRLMSMQAELERYRERDRGRIYDGILTEIARLYSDNVGVVDRVEDRKVRKQLNYLFMDFLQILESYGVGMQKSNEGDKRSAKYCQVIERVPTEDASLHDTVVKSRNIGFYIENRPIVKEMVDVYIYTKPNKDAAEEQPQADKPDSAPTKKNLTEEETK